MNWKFDKERVIRAARELLIAIGEDPERPGLVGTAERFADAWEEILAGYGEDEKEVLKVVFDEITLLEATNDANYLPDPVIIKDIEIYSLCEHHLLPIRGRALIAYVPNGGRILGLSKIPRLVEVYTRRLQVQERFTAQIANALMNAERLKPLGVMVVTRCVHFCMLMRGVEKQLSYVIVPAIRGLFLERRELESKVQSYAQEYFSPHGP